MGGCLAGVWDLEEDGIPVLFWFDDWLGGGPLCSVFAGLLWIVVNKLSSIKDC